MQKLSGKINICGKSAYAAQQAWIQNATLRDNILFGKPYDEELYNQILDACSLNSDLKLLPSSDKTEIGEKVNSFLSCQKYQSILKIR